MATKKKATVPAAKAARASKAVASRKPAKVVKTATAKKLVAKAKAAKAVPSRKTETATKAPRPVAKPTPPPARAAAPQKKVAVPPATGKVTEPVTAKKNVPADASETPKTDAPEAVKPAAKAKAPRTTIDDLALDVDEKDELLEEEKRDLAKALRDDDDELLETAFVPTDTSERFILVVDEEGQRRTETVSIVQQILPNAVIEVADDPDEALEVMEEAEFDTYVVNFLMPGFSASPFVKAVANHPDHPLLIGFAADKISDALDQRKGLKIIPLKRLFDLDVPADSAAGKDKAGAED